MILVVRVDIDGNLRNSRPCNHCIRSMIHYNIRKVMYSDDNGNIIVEDPTKMDQSHISNGNKFTHQCLD